MTLRSDLAGGFLPGGARIARDARVPVIVVSGFLGSGKTTLLKRVLATPALANSMLIVNEIGEIGIDHHLLERSDDRTVLLDNGCMCCVVRADLQALLVELSMQRRRGEIPSFERVIIETSGLADPGPVAKTLYGDGPLAREYRLAHVVTLVDPLNAATRAASPDIAVQQVAAADLIVVTKADRADASQLAQARDWARQCNLHAAVREASHGGIDIALLSEASTFDVFARPGPALFAGGSGAAGGGAGAAQDDAASAAQDAGAMGAGRYLASAAPRGRHAADVSSFTIAFDAPLPRARYELFMDLVLRLRGADLLRIKGVLSFENAPHPVVLQGVGHQFDRPVPLSASADWPAGRSALVFIARRLNRDRVLALWQALAGLEQGAG